MHHRPLFLLSLYLQGGTICCLEKSLVCPSKFRIQNCTRLGCSWVGG